MSSNPIIESITCPINGTIMKDPVQGNDGQTYERSAITLWLTNHKSESPITKQYMTVNDLKVNAAIRFLCDKYHAGELTVHGVEELDNGTCDDNGTGDNGQLSQISHQKINSSVYHDSTNLYLMVKLTAENLISHGTVSHDVVIVIDRSGSMQFNVEAKDQDGNSMEDGLSQQDIVNHSAKMVAKTLGLNNLNRLAIIIFDNVSETVFNLMPMTEMNCGRAISQINSIVPRSTTNIWSATESAIDLLWSRDDKTRNPHIILLTDGLPNVSPARGEVHALEKKMLELNFNPPIYAFGFGYKLKEGLLYGLAKASGGGVGHIPDGGMIATVFSNFIATIMCTVAYNVKLIVELDARQDVALSHIHGDFKYDISTDSTTQKSKIVIDIGTIQNEQSRDILMSGIVNATKYTYTYKIADTYYEIVKDVNSEPAAPDISALDSNITRLFLVENIRLAIKLKVRGKSAESIYLKMVAHFHDNNIDVITEGYWGECMYETLTDQVRLALSEDPTHVAKLNGITVPYFTKWGMWYLDQLSWALGRQIKPNFKDSACCFGGRLFREIVDYASDQFDNLPPPCPSNYNTSSFGYASSSSSAVYRGLGGGVTSIQPIRMSTYNSQDNPCFDGNCLISMADGSKKRVSKLLKGDTVSCRADPYDSTSKFVVGTVVCLLKTIVVGGICEMVQFDNGLKITPWHPVWVCESRFPVLYTAIDWKFPFDLKSISNGVCQQTEVYSILLDNWHTCCINDTWCISLGHNYDKGILKHNYFGSQKVVNDMRQMIGWEEGHIVIQSDDIVRDSSTGLICEINQDINLVAD